MLDSLQYSSLQCASVLFVLGSHFGFRNRGLCPNGQASNYNTRLWHRKPGLSSISLQNNACSCWIVRKMTASKTKWFQSFMLDFSSLFMFLRVAYPSACRSLRHMRHLYLELLHFKPEVNITLQRVTFHCHKRSELATAAGIEKCLT